MAVQTVELTEAPEFRELSKRVDVTNVLVMNLDQRFEAHRVRNDEKLVKIVDGIARVEQAQARMMGAGEGEDRAEDRAAVQHTHRQQLKSNLIAIVSLAALVLSGAATVLATVLHP